MQNYKAENLKRLKKKKKGEWQRLWKMCKIPGANNGKIVFKP